MAEQLKAGSLRATYGLKSCRVRCASSGRTACKLECFLLTYTHSCDGSPTCVSGLLFGFKTAHQFPLTVDYRSQNTLNGLSKTQYINKNHFIKWRILLNHELHLNYIKWRHPQIYKFLLGHLRTKDIMVQIAVNGLFDFKTLK